MFFSFWSKNKRKLSSTQSNFCNVWIILPWFINFLMQTIFFQAPGTLYPTNFSPFWISTVIVRNASDRLSHYSPPYFPCLALHPSYASRLLFLCQSNLVESAYTGSTGMAYATHANISHLLISYYYRRQTASTTSSCPQKLNKLVNQRI